MFTPFQCPSLNRMVDPSALEDRSPSQVVRALRQRGIEVTQANGRAQGLWPEDAAAAKRFYALMKRYSFRLFLRDAIRFRRSLALTKLTRFVSHKTAQRYAGELTQMGIFKASGGCIEVLPEAENFGTTLEWFVAQALRQELSIPAIHGVRLADTTHGGDYDVIGLVGSLILYVEVKSSPPRHIEESEVDGFLRRLSGLRPDLAIFFVDTNLRMRDKVVVMFTQAARRVLAHDLDALEAIAGPERLEREIFTLGPRLYIANSKQDAIANLRRCVRTFFDARFDLGRFLTAPSS